MLQKTVCKEKIYIQNNKRLNTIKPTKNNVKLKKTYYLGIVLIYNMFFYINNFCGGEREGQSAGSDVTSAT